MTPAAADSSRVRASRLHDRILVLVPHEPTNDPRVGWVTSLCAEVARTDVVSCCYERKGPAVAIDGRVVTERFLLPPYIQETWWLRRLYRHADSRLVQEFLACQHGTGSVANGGPARSWPARLRSWARYHLGGALRGAVQAASVKEALTDPLWLRARGITAPPRLVICEDFYALPAGICLKRLFGCRLIYDAHEFTPEADVFCHPFESWLWQRLERRLVRHVDAMATVTPQLAQEFKKLYGVRVALSVPNACPLAEPFVPPGRRPPGSPVRFLLQGGASRGRGFEALLSGWRRLADPRAVLCIRCVPCDYLEGLRQASTDLIDKGLVEFLPAVPADQLVQGAAFADVGVIPYPVKVGNRDKNRNHLYCCPNKLAQYMQAGLAILGTNSVFVSERLQEYRCGLTFDLERPESLTRAVLAMVEDLSLLETLKANALRAAREDFHWARQARDFRELIGRLYEAGTDRGRRAA